jgi:hypothetical protein
LTKWYETQESSLSQWSGREVCRQREDAYFAIYKTAIWKKEEEKTHSSDGTSTSVYANSEGKREVKTEAHYEYKRTDVYGCSVSIKVEPSGSANEHRAEVQAKVSYKKKFQNWYVEKWILGGLLAAGRTAIFLFY